MIRIMVAVFIVTIFFSAILTSPQVQSYDPIVGPNIVVEAFRFSDGNIYIVKSEIIPGGYYYDGAIRRISHKRVWCEIYGAFGNRIKLYKIVMGTIIPAKPETWKFEDFDIQDFRRRIE